MTLESEIKNVLFKIGKEIKLHKIDKDNIILEINYDLYTAELMKIFKNYLTD